jgi:hypothetical protein
MLILPTIKTQSFFIATPQVPTSSLLPFSGRNPKIAFDECSYYHEKGIGRRIVLK